MKHTVKKNQNRRSNTNLYIYRRPYPNAAEPSYYLDKAIDIMLAVATGMGTVTALFFLVTI